MAGDEAASASSWDNNSEGNMTTDEIRQAHFDSLHLKWANEDMIKYGSPSNTRMTLKHHPEHEARRVSDSMVRHTP